MSTEAERTWESSHSHVCQAVTATFALPGTCRHQRGVPRGSGKGEAESGVWSWLGMTWKEPNMAFPIVRESASRRYSRQRGQCPTTDARCPGESDLYHQPVFVVAAGVAELHSRLLPHSSQTPLLDGFRRGFLGARRLPWC